MLTSKISLKSVCYTAIIGLLAFMSLNKLVFKNIKLVEEVSSAILYPFLVAQNKVSSSIKSCFKNLDLLNLDLLNTNTELNLLVDFYKAENENLQAELIELYSLKSYAKNFKELSSFLSKYNADKAIFSQIILKNIDSAGHFIYLDAGRAKQVKKNMLVVYKNCLIGRIDEVYKHWSKAVLVTDKDSKVAAYCNSNNVIGIHVGQNNLQETKLTFVNHLKTINSGDLVISSGEGTVFPRGFGLGHIKSFKKEGFNYDITIKPLLNIQDLEFCYIISKN